MPLCASCCAFGGCTVHNKRLVCGVSYAFWGEHLRPVLSLLGVFSSWSLLLEFLLLGLSLILSAEGSLSEWSLSPISFSF